jgi:hypothetical protein
VCPRKAPTFNRLQVLRERLEAPVDARLQRVERHAFDVLERAGDHITVLGPGGGDAEPAVAHDHTRDAVPARRREVAVPQDLGVVVRVDVDEPGGEDEAVEVDDLRDVGVGRGARGAGRVDRGDAVAGDQHVGGPSGRAGAVDERGASEQRGHAP